MSYDAIGMETIVQGEHIAYESILLSGIQKVSNALVTDYDGGIMAMISLLSVLSAKHRVQFKVERAKFTEIVNTDVYNERATLRITRRIRSQYAVAVADCLSKIVDVLDAAGLLWKSKTELVGRES